jgi:hypothetical protein
MRTTTSASESVEATVARADTSEEKCGGARFTYDVECRGADGNVKWSEVVENLVTTAGKNDLLDKYFKGSAYTAAWYLGLKSAIAGVEAITDTMASHATWSEVFAYTGGTNRPALVFAGNAAAGSNTANAIPFAINATVTVGGAFVTNTAATSPGNTGVLYSVRSFSADRPCLSGDTLTVTLTVTIT